MGQLSEDSPETLAARYAGWDTEELIRAVELEAEGYRSEALELIRRELDRRGVGVEARTIFREAEVENARRHYVGVAGWLVVFVVLTALGSVVTILFRGFFTYRGLVALYGWVVIGLILLRRREAPRHAKIALALSWLASAAALFPPAPITGGMFLEAVFKSLWLAIWWPYFSVSKRVRMTFRPESEWFDPPLTQEQDLAQVEEFRASDRLSRDEVHDRALR